MQNGGCLKVESIMSEFKKNLNILANDVCRGERKWLILVAFAKGKLN